MKLKITNLNWPKSSVTWPCLLEFRNYQVQITWTCMIIVIFVITVMLVNYLVLSPLIFYLPLIWNFKIFIKRITDQWIIGWLWATMFYIAWSRTNTYVVTQTLLIMVIFRFWTLVSAMYDSKEIVQCKYQS